MAKVKSHHLDDDTRVSSYKVLSSIGRGWEGEVYKVAEVPTQVVRAMKLFRTEALDTIRDLAHVAWYFEQVRSTGHFPIYHHCGQWFFDDDNGCWFLVFEFVDGVPLAKLSGSEELFMRLANAISTVHQHGFGVGDLSSLENVFERRQDRRIIFVDCEPGKPDHPNIDFHEDCVVELPDAAKRMFSGVMPPRVVALLERLKSAKSFNDQKLASALYALNV